MYKSKLLSLLLIFTLFIFFGASVRMKSEQSPTANNEHSSERAPSDASSTTPADTNSTGPLTNLQVFAKLTPPTVTNLERVKIIANHSTFVFDFFNPDNTSIISAGINGYYVMANRKDFPAIYLSFMSMSVGFIGPCGLHTPHIHPRANEIAFAVYGAFYTGFIAENGAPLIMNYIKPGQATFFGRGWMHWLANLSCEPAMYTSSFSDEDPGITNLAQNLFSMPDDIISPTMGYLDPVTLEILAEHIPANITSGLAQCVATCANLEALSLESFNIFAKKPSKLKT